MRKLPAFAAALIVCAAPALAQSGRSDGACGPDPETTGSLPAGPPDLRRPDGRPGRAEATPPEESWQDAFRETAEQRRQDLLACGVD